MDIDNEKEYFYFNEVNASFFMGTGMIAIHFTDKEGHEERILYGYLCSPGNHTKSRRYMNKWQVICVRPYTHQMFYSYVKTKSEGLNKLYKFRLENSEWAEKEQEHEKQLQNYLVFAKTKYKELLVSIPDMLQMSGDERGTWFAGEPSEWSHIVKHHLIRITEDGWGYQVELDKSSGVNCYIIVPGSNCLQPGWWGRFDQLDNLETELNKLPNTIIDRKRVMFGK
jgi:hypothetical protein